MTAIRNSIEMIFPNSIYIFENMRNSNNILAKTISYLSNSDSSFNMVSLSTIRDTCSDFQHHYNQLLENINALSSFDSTLSTEILSILQGDSEDSNSSLESLINKIKKTYTTTDDINDTLLKSSIDDIDNATKIVESVRISFIVHFSRRLAISYSCNDCNDVYNSTIDNDDISINGSID